MRAKKGFYVIVYDIVDDKRRNRVAKLLESKGERVNKSVFECLLTDSQVGKLKEQIAKRIDNETDQVVYYYLCLDCYTKAVYQPERSREDDVMIVKIV